MKRTGQIILALGFFLMAQAAQADWTATKRLTWNSGGSWAAAIGAYPPANVYVVWIDSTPGNSEIFFKRSTDSGSSWAPSQRLTWTPGNSSPASIAVNAYGYIYVVWYDDTPGNDEIYFKKSTDGGSSWSANQRLTWSSEDSINPEIAADSFGHLHVVWYESLMLPEVYYKKSTNAGSSWLTSKRLTWTAETSSHPRIGVESSGNLHVIWKEEVTGNEEIYYKKSTDNGETWTTSKRLTWTPGDSWYPSMAVTSSGDIHVAWDDDTPGNREIYYKKSTAGGDTWTTNKRITWTSGASLYSGIAVDSSGYLHLVWYEDVSGNDEIFHSQSTDGGASWSPGQRLTWNSGTSTFPVVSVDGSDNLHVIWSDNTPGNVEVYYKKYIK
jgi:hypothetical protein